MLLNRKRYIKICLREVYHYQWDVGFEMFDKTNLDVDTAENC